MKIRTLFTVALVASLAGIASAVKPVDHSDAMNGMSGMSDNRCVDANTSHLLGRVPPIPDNDRENEQMIGRSKEPG